MTGADVFAAAVGKLQRQNPLPPGRYWIDVFEKDAAAFRAWLERSPGVRVQTTQHFDESPARDWYLFDVTAPTSWEGPGLPTIATADVKSSEDTVQRPPPPPSVADQMLGAWTSSLSTGKTLAGVALLVVAVVALKGAHR